MSDLQNLIYLSDKRQSVSDEDVKNAAARGIELEAGETCGYDPAHGRLLANKMGHLICGPCEVEAARRMGR